MKNLNHAHWNRTRDIPACSAVPSTNCATALIRSIQQIVWQEQVRSVTAWGGRAQEEKLMELRKKSRTEVHGLDKDCQAT